MESSRGPRCACRVSNTRTTTPDRARARARAGQRPRFSFTFTSTYTFFVDLLGLGCSRQGVVLRVRRAGRVPEIAARPAQHPLSVRRVVFARAEDALPALAVGLGRHLGGADLGLLGGLSGPFTSCSTCTSNRAGASLRRSRRTTSPPVMGRPSFRGRTSPASSLPGRARRTLAPPPSSVAPCIITTSNDAPSSFGEPSSTTPESSTWLRRRRTRACLRPVDGLGAHDVQHEGLHRRTHVHAAARVAEVALDRQGQSAAPGALELVHLEHEGGIAPAECRVARGQERRALRARWS